MGEKLRGLILKSDNFEVSRDNVFIKGMSKPGMLLIWADFCGHCHRFMPTFNQIERSFGNNFILASIESEDLSKELSDSLKVEGFPTIKFFDQYGKISRDYNGRRDKGSILTEICDVYKKCL